MSDATQNEGLHGVVGYYDNVDDTLAAARRVRDAGFKKWDTYTPFPIHGIDEAMGVKPTILPWIVLTMGLTGLCVGLLLQWYTNAYDYVFLISGKPDWSLPANIPVTFEIVILFSAYTSFFGMLALNKLPHLSNPLHKLERFLRVTDDKFAICIEAKDSSFDAGRVRKLLEGGSEHIEDCPVDTSRFGLPMWMHGMAAIATCLTFIPLAVAFKGRFATSDKPRLHVWPDMDWQRKRKAQAGWEEFADGRSMRLPVEGTVAVGELRNDHEFAFAVAQGSEIPPRATFDPGTMGTAGGASNLQWIAGMPAAVVVNEAFLERGRERYKIYCSPCHGQQGNGLGAVAMRATSIDAKKWGWVAPKALTTDSAKNYTNGELFHIASYGISSMKGYASQVKPQDRWAIIAYVRALQATQGLDQGDQRARDNESRIEDAPTIESMRVSTAGSGGQGD